MPKISEFPTGITLSGTEEIPMVQSGLTKNTTPAAIAAYAEAASTITDLGWYNVKDFGAVGNGVANDTAAIQAAVDTAGAAGGGVVYFPPGTYSVRPTHAEVLAGGFVGAVHIAYDNITLQGAGVYLSKIDFVLWSGNSPAGTAPGTNFDVVSGQVIRGNAFLLPSGTRVGFTCRDLQIDGNGLGNTGNNGYPANTSTGLGYDNSHQAISGTNASTNDNILIENCWFHHWQGGGFAMTGNQGRIVIRNCRMNASDGSIISTTSTNLLVEGCELYDGSGSGIENTMNDGRNRYHNNYIYDCHIGAVVQETSDGFQTYAICDVSGNQFARCPIALYCPGINNAIIHNNQFIDCQFSVYQDNPDGGGSDTEYILGSHTHIHHNFSLIDTITHTGAAIYVGGTSSNPVNQMLIENNVALVTPNGVNSGKFVRAGIELAEPQSSDFRLKYRDNYTYGNFPGNQLDDNSVGQSIGQLLSTTGETSILSVWDRHEWLKIIDIFYEVRNGATNLTLKIKWDNDAGAQVWTPINVVSQPVGFYSVSYNVSPHNLFDNSNLLQLTAQAGTANNIRISARIRD